MNISNIVKTVVVSSVILLPAVMFGESAFEGVSNNVLRENLDLYGGSPKRIVVADNGNLFIAVESPNGIFCSSDGGTSWSTLPIGSDIGSPTDIVLGENDTTAYFIGGIRLYKTDLCATLTELTVGTSSNFASSLVYKGGVLLVAARDGTIFRSTDNGASFVQITIDASITSSPVISSTSNANEFWAMAQVSDEKRFYKSTDGGQSWSDTGVTLDCDDCSEFRVSPDGILVVTAANKVYISTDGTTFVEKTPSSMVRSYISFTDSEIWVGAKSTSDNGDTWSDLNDTATEMDSELIGPVAKSPDGSIMYVGSQRGVAKSSDSGLTWDDAVNGITALTVSAIVQSSDKNTVYLAGPGGLAKTTNFLSGATWTYPIDVSGGGDNPTALFLPDPSTPTTLLVAVRSTVYKTTDGGTTFQEVTINSSVYSKQDDEVVGFAKTSAGTLYAIYNDNDTKEGGVLRSADNGDTWSDASFTIGTTINSIATLGDDVFIGVGEEGDSSADKRGIYKFDGSTWSQLTGAFDGHIINDIAVDEDNDIIYAVSGGQSAQASIFRSKDGGGTWDDLKNNGIPSDGWFRAVAVDPQSPQVVYAASGRPAARGAIYRSEDSGDSWSLYAELLTDEVPQDLLIDGPLMASAVGINSFDQLRCNLRKAKGGKLVVSLRAGDKILTSLSSFGLKNPKVVLKQLGGGKKFVKKFKNKKAKAVFKGLAKGKYKAICKAKNLSNKIKIKSKKKQIK